MRLYAHCLILMLAPTVAHASEALAGNARGGCSYTSTENDRGGSVPGPARAPATAPAKPVVAPAASSGGGNDDDVLQRMRAPKWHSFLPGMFR